MRRLAIALFGVLTACSLQARHIGFEIDAFNRLFPVTCTNNAVCSPAAFEIDCAMAAEAMDTISRARVAETIGVLIDLESSFAAVQEGYAVRTNGFSFVNARAFLVPEMRLAKPAFRSLLHNSFHAAVCLAFPPDGAEAWLDAATDGQVPGFKVPPPDSRTDSRYVVCDLVSVRAAWTERFPTANTRRRVFNTPSGGKVAVPFMQDVREADIWQAKYFTLVRLPLCEEAWFYAIMPNEDGFLSDVRGDLTSSTVDRLLTAVESHTEKGSRHGLIDVALPRLDFDQTVDFLDVMRYFRFPVKGLGAVAGDLPARAFLQRTRFTLMEQGPDEEPLLHRVAPDDEDEEETAKPRAPVARVVFDRPFVFFIHHTRTQTVPIAGIYAGQ